MASMEELEVTGGGDEQVEWLSWTERAGESTSHCLCQLPQAYNPVPQAQRKPSRFRQLVIKLIHNLREEKFR